MNVRNFALITGLIYLLVGILGFIPALLTPLEAGRDLAVQASSGRLLGLFPVNAVHNLVHLAIGAWGLMAYRNHANAISFARGLAVLYALLAILGLISAGNANNLFGLAPLFSHDIWLHALTALVAAYFGWVHEHAGAEEPARV